MSDHHEPEAETDDTQASPAEAPPLPLRASDTELEGLWRSAAEAPPTVVPAARLARRWRRQLWLVTAVEALLIGAVAVWTILALRRPLSGVELVIWVNAWTLATVATTYALWNRRGMWRPLTESTPRFLAHWRERCRRGLRTVSFVRAVVAFETAFLVTLFAATGRGRFTTYATLAVVAVGYQIWSVLFERSCLRQLERIRGLESDYSAAEAADREAALPPPAHESPLSL